MRLLVLKRIKADTLVIDMDETNPPNALDHHYTLYRYLGIGKTGKTFPEGKKGKEKESTFVSKQT